MKMRFLLLTSVSLVVIYIAIFNNNIMETKRVSTQNSPDFYGKKTPAAIIKDCQRCHLTNGDNYVPENGLLSGQGETYLIKQLEDFSRGIRVVQHLSASIHQLPLLEIARYAKNYTVREKANIIGKPSVLGKALYNTGDDNRHIPACMSCHVKGGQGISSAAIPALIGQSYEYIIEQLTNFKSGKRHNDKNQMMQNIAVRLNNADITSLASHIVSLNSRKD